MIPVMFANPATKTLLLTATILAVIYVVGHLLRRKTAEAADKSCFRLRAAIWMPILAAALTAGAWTYVTEVQSVLNYLAQILGLVLVIVAVLAMGNALRAPGSVFARLILAPLPLFVAVLTAAGTMYTFNVRSPELWADNAYAYSVAAVNYLVWFYAVLFVGTVAVWAVMRGIRWVVGFIARLTA
jgi:hypothetical protein